MLAPVSRYRPPTRPGSKFITAEGHARLAAELDQLWRVERPAVTRAVSEAAAQGDRSENAEYTYGKKRLREIDSRVRFLRKRLEGMVVVSAPPSDLQRVFFGAWITLEDDQGAESCHRIVGPDEFDLAPGYISMDSPLARALLGKRLDDEVHVETPTGRRLFVILAIDYTGVKPPARS
jgi:transcription elongation factor GreB